MIINHNMASLNTYRQMSTNMTNTSKSLEKLSSGLRINKAGDDAAGLAISEKMRGQIRGLDQASRNSQDGISMISTAEGALSETHSILQRMKELATQSANDTNVTSDRSEIQKEINQLSSEINRIGNTTEFNTQKLLKGKDVAVVSTAQTVATTTAGEAGVVTGATTALAVNASSVVAVASSTSVQGNTADATGTVGTTAQTITSVAGAKSVASQSGLTFKSEAANATLNGSTIKISQQAGTSAASSISVTGSGATQVIDFQIGTDASGKSLFTGDDRGSLVNFLKNSMPSSTQYTALNIAVDDPLGAATAEKLVGFQDPNAVATVQTYSTATMSGGVTEVVGKNTFTITDKMEEAGDTITVGGQTFTAKASGADVAKGEFNINATHAKATSAGTIAPASNIALTKAVWNSGVITTMGAGTSNTLAFGGVNVTINTAAAAIAANATSNAAVSVTMVNGATAQDTATALKSALEAARDFGGGGGPLAGYTFSDVGAALTITASEARGATDNAFKMVIAGGGTLAMVDGNKDATDVANTDGVNSTYTITVNGTAYDLKNAELAQIDGTKNKEELAAIIGSAKSAGSVALSTVADVTFNSAGGLVITSKTGGAGTAISFTDAVGADSGSINGILGTDAAATKVAGAATGATADDQAASLRVAINANATLNSRFVASGSATSAEVVMTEKVGKAEGTALAQVTLSGGGADDKLVITDKSGRNLKTVTIAQNSSDALDATTVDANGNLTIKLANASAYKNTAAEIQKAVHALGTVNGVDFSQYDFTAQGDWDTKATGDNMVSKNATLVGGTQEVKGDYSFDISKAFALGDKVQIKGQTFTAVTSGAIGSKGEFDISGGDTNLQAASLRDAISLNSVLKATYTSGGTGSTVSLTEKTASGVDLKTTDLAVKATGTAGEYSIDTSEILENGAVFVLDGKEIAVSNKNANVGYADGTAIKVADTAAGQTSALAEAINKNADLKVKYTASVGTDGSLVLKQNDMEESATAPEVATKNSSIGQFTSSLQIGANSGQSITIDVNDMRSTALGVTGDGSVGTVAANNGLVASFVTISNVTNGTDNTNVEYALDVSDHTKATNAISVISDAIEAVSAERSKIGAFQNRLEHTIANLGTSSENLTAAESRVRDVDMAKEMMQFQKNNILTQAAQAMMAQANQQPQGVLQLLR